MFRPFLLFLAAVLWSNGSFTVGKVIHANDDVIMRPYLGPANEYHILIKSNFVTVVNITNTA